MKTKEINKKSNLVFVVEDNDWYSKMLAHIITLNPELEVKVFKNGKTCLEHLYEAPFAVTLDYSLPDMTGLEVLSRIKKTNPEIEVIVVSEQEDISTAVELLKHGAYDYMTKGSDIKNRIFNVIANIFKGQQLKQEVASLKSELVQKYEFSKYIKGDSRQMRGVFDLISKTLNNDITVSITGETGTGKEMVAKAIHYNSKRKNKSFVAVNVAAVPRELIESEFFGHEKGAFTGANTRRIGKFEEADGGTLFLDEIGDMPWDFQTKLLRVLQEKEVVRVGSNTPFSIDVRIVVATHKNLQEEVENGNFREDLFYRLKGLMITLPPLRERGNDIILLAQHFIKEFCSSNALANKVLSKDAKEKLLNYSFPGNVRELRTLAELAVVMSSKDEITSEDFKFDMHKMRLGHLPLHKEFTLKQFDLLIVKDFLDRYQGNIRLVAPKLNIGVATIYRMLKAEEEIMSEEPGKVTA